MPKIIDKVAVSVRDNGSKGEKRTVTVDIEGDAHLFQVSDLFSKEGVIDSLEKTLKRATKDATQGYIESGKSFLRGAASSLKPKSKTPKPQAPTQTPKTHKVSPQEASS